MSKAARIWRCFFQQGRTPAAPDVDLLGRTALVTGGARGIGLEASIGLAARGATVLVASRRARGPRGEEALERVRAAAFDDAQQVVPFAVDLAEVSSVVECARLVREWLQGRPLDVLVCNAGVGGGDQCQVNSQGVEKTWAVNVLGHAALFWELEDMLLKADRPRVVFVSAELHIFADNPVEASHVESAMYSKSAAYFNSKAASILFAREIHKRHPSITSIALHPGVVDTEFGTEDMNLPAFVKSMKSRMLLDQVSGAATTLRCAVDPNMSPDGPFLYFTNYQALPVNPSPVASNEATGTRLYEHLLGIVRKGKDAG